jgi:hypothetical protein
MSLSGGPEYFFGSAFFVAVDRTAESAGQCPILLTQQKLPAI